MKKKNKNSSSRNNNYKGNNFNQNDKGNFYQQNFPNENSNKFNQRGGYRPRGNQQRSIMGRGGYN